MINFTITAFMFYKKIFSFTLGLFVASGAFLVCLWRSNNRNQPSHFINASSTVPFIMGFEI